jgi:hypothetical protein
MPTASSDKESRNKSAQLWSELGATYLTFSKDYGMNTVRTVVVLNSGAILALLNLFGQKSDAFEICQLQYAAIVYLFGIVFGVLASAAGYFNFVDLAHNVPSPAELESYVDNGDTSGWDRLRKTKIPQITYYFGVTFVVLAVISLLAGTTMVIFSVKP